MKAHQFPTIPRAIRGRWWPRLRAIFNNGNAPDHEFPRLLDTDSFSRALHQEWSRSQRLGLPLALIMIASSSPPSPEPSLLALARDLRDRLRCTDILGWHQPGKLGIILAHTPGEAAWSLVADIQARLDAIPGLAETLTVEIYACPEQSLRHDEGAAL